MDLFEQRLLQILEKYFEHCVKNKHAQSVDGLRLFILEKAKGGSNVSVDVPGSSQSKLSGKI